LNPTFVRGKGRSIESQNIEVARYKIIEIFKKSMVRSSNLKMNFDDVSVAMVALLVKPL
jgi:hypothetical protein